MDLKIQNTLRNDVRLHLNKEETVAIIHVKKQKTTPNAFLVS